MPLIKKAFLTPDAVQQLEISEYILAYKKDKTYIRQTIYPKDSHANKKSQPILTNTPSPSTKKAKHNIQASFLFNVNFPGAEFNSCVKFISLDPIHQVYILSTLLLSFLFMH